MPDREARSGLAARLNCGERGEIELSLRLGRLVAALALRLEHGHHLPGEADRFGPTFLGRRMPHPERNDQHWYPAESSHVGGLGHQAGSASGGIAIRSLYRTQGQDQQKFDLAPRINVGNHLLTIESPGVFP